MEKKEGIFLRHSVNQIIFAAVLLFVGIFLLLSNIGVISLEIKDVIVECYPFVFLVLSLLIILRAIIRHKSGRLLWGFFLFVFFLMLSLDRLKIISFHLSDFWRLWPVLLIYLGLNLLLKRRKVKVFIHRDLSSQSLENEMNFKNSECQTQVSQINNDKKVRVFSVGDLELKKSNWSLEPMNLSNSIGDYFIDFSKAYIPEKETSIAIQGWIGDVKMIVPDGIPVKVKAKVKIGDIRIFDLRSSDLNRHLAFETTGYEEAVKKLNITIELKIGSVRIDKV